MENNKKVEDFLNSIKDNRIITIGGTAASGKSWITSMICEYFLLKNKECVVIDTCNDNTIFRRLSKSTNFLNKSGKVTFFSSYSMDDIYSYVQKLNKRVVIIDNVSMITSSKNNTSQYDLLKTFLDKLKELSYSNDLTLIYTTQIRNGYTPNSSQGLNISPSLSYSSDTIGVCYKDEDNNMRFKVEKSRTGIFIKNMDFINLSALIKGIIRKEKIAKLLAEN